VTDEPVPETVPPTERPLRLGEVLAEAVRIYGERIWAAAGLGLFSAGVFLLARLQPVVWVVLVSLLIAVGWAVATRLALGDPWREAWLAAARRAPVLLVYTVVATLPLAALAVVQGLFVVLAVLWLALVGFSIPVTVVESSGGLRGIHELGFGLRRSLELARAEYVHAAGVIAALVLVVALLVLVLFGALRGFAENGDVLAFALSLGVLAPFFYLGLAVLYFDQRARALSSRREN
jgi:hypothetical protein